jgi:L-asparaginase
MTLETVVTKLMWVLGQAKDLEEIRRLFYQPVQNDPIR